MNDQSTPGLEAAATDSAYFQLPDAKTARDLATFITRAKSVDPQAAVRLQGRGGVLGVYVCTLAPSNLFDTETPTVLGLRAISLGESSDLDVTAPAVALLDRLARIEESGFRLMVPPVTATAPWAGIAPPTAGWERAGFYLSDDARSDARAGIEAVDRALPENPGHAVVNTVRSRIWASPLEATDATVTLPIGVAFALEVLGFLPPRATEPLLVFTNGDWARVSGKAGHVLVRTK
ncbi:hypothetical protein [Rothia endophytica]|uniref:hypothetical protein n=1 Tax=Rothia endophytica TaxID=1324766 RepID=UPI001F44D34E|nr:hypothetical protein [Rothia endophytica]